MTKSVKYSIARRKREDFHGKKNTRLYRLWRNVVSRCHTKTDKDYPRYGGRGIYVCDEWRTFKPFYNWAIENGYKQGLTLDRIDNNKGYSPSNCRWATIKEQSNNKRNNRYITIDGITKTATQWAEEIGVDRHVILYRLNAGWSTDKLLEKPNRGVRRI